MKGFNNSIGCGHYMAGQKAKVAVLTSLLLLFAGCIYADTPEWGTGDGQLKVSINSEGTSADIESNLGEGYEETVPLIDCQGSKIKVTGLIISSNIYNEHPLDDSILSSMGAAIIIHKMTWSEAESVEEGTAGRVNLKDWSSPTNPSEAVGSKLSENQDDWAVIGIIPGYENIADGLNVLEHWHQPIELTGYLADGGSLSTAIDEETCKLDGQGHGMVVTNIKTAEGVVSKTGESDDEYSMGDTDIFGGWGFIFFFLVAGVGGGVGLFILSTMVIRQGAKSTAETLLGREGFAKAVQMKKDLKKSKKEGLESASDRAEKAQKQSPPPKKTKTEDVAIAGFNLDSVLSSSASEDSGPSQFGGGSSVVVTDEAREMTNNVASQVPSSSPMPSSSVVSTQPVQEQPRGHFSATAPTRATQPTAAAQPKETQRPVKRRKSVKRSAPEPEPAPQPAKQSSPSVADDDDFSDFSF